MIPAMTGMSSVFANSRLQILHQCDCCGEPIFDSHLYVINGQKFCDGCIGKVIERSFKAPYTDGLVCSKCGRPILEDESYQIEGQALCEDCIRDQVKGNFLENL